MHIGFDMLYGGIRFLQALLTTPMQHNTKRTRRGLNNKAEARIDHTRNETEIRGEEENVSKNTYE